MPQSKNSSPDPVLRIKVVGIGGAGGNAVSRMSGKIRGVDFVAINTDHQDLLNTTAKHKIVIGRTITRGLGAGMDPDIGREAAEENRDDIAKAIEGADLVFLTCGLGGGTGSGATPVVADIAKEFGILTIAVVTKPFLFEGTQRQKIALDAWKHISNKVDAIITVPNDRIFNLISRTTPLLDAFTMIDDILHQAVQGISDLIMRPGLINVDFADIRSIMQHAGEALLGIGLAAGENRAAVAASSAIRSPLLEIGIEGARGVLFNVSGRENMSMSEINEAAKIITESADPEARIIFGATFDPRLKRDEMKISVIATFSDEAGTKTERPMVEREPQVVRRIGVEAKNTGLAATAVPTHVEDSKSLKDLLAEKLKDKEAPETPAFFRRKKK